MISATEAYFRMERLGTATPHNSKPKNMPKEKVLPLVKEVLLEVKKRVESGERRYSMVWPSFLADAFNVRVDKVIWALHRLNLEGMVGQPNHSGHSEDRYYVNAIAPPRVVVRKRRVHGPASPQGTLSIWAEKEPVKLPRFSKRLQMRMG